MRLQFVLGADWESRLISYWGNGYGGWSHVDAVMPDGELLGARDDVIETPLMKLPAGVRLRPPHYETWVRRSVVEILATPDQDALWERYLRHQIGEKYDSGAIIDFILGKPGHHACGHWICSALQMGALRACGKAFPTHIPDAQITPNGLYLLCTAGLGGLLVGHGV